MSASMLFFMAVVFAPPILLALYGGRAVWRDMRDGAWAFAIGGLVVVGISVILLGMLAWGFSGFVRTGGL